MIAPGIAPTPPNHAPIAVSTFAPNVEPDTLDTNTLVKLSSFHFMSDYICGISSIESTEGIWQISESSTFQKSNS